MEFVTSGDGTRIAITRGGFGYALLLVHGSSVDHHYWIPLRGALEQFFDVWVMDRRGRGASGDHEAYSLAREAEDIAAVVREIGRPVAIFGHSYGGLCALEAARIEPRITNVLVYEAPAPWRGDEWSDDMDTRMQNLLDAGQPEEGILIFAREFVKIPEPQLAGLRTLPIWQLYVANARSLQRELRAVKHHPFDVEPLRKLTTPVSIFVGELSSRPYHESAEMLQSALPNARLHVLQGHDHQSFVADPEGFAKLLKNCISGVEAA